MNEDKELGKKLQAEVDQYERDQALVDFAKGHFELTWEHLPNANLPPEVWGGDKVPERGTPAVQFPNVYGRHYATGDLYVFWWWPGWGNYSILAEEHIPTTKENT